MENLNIKIFNDAKQLMSERFSTIIKYFLEDAEVYIEEINKALNDENIHDLITPAHTIKSSSKQLGAEKLSSIANDMEELARNIDENGKGDINRLKKYLNELKICFKDTSAELKKIKL